jgi:fructokinase
VFKIVFGGFMEPIYGAVEAGGTKFVCMVAKDERNIISETRISTTNPQETLDTVFSFFHKTCTNLSQTLTSIGLASFGPVDLNPVSETFGSITATPKLKWLNTPILSKFEKEFKVPIAFDTDVDAAAIGEGIWGAGLGLSDFIYVTIGTGIGGGCMVNGAPVHGLIHPELGHMLIPHNFSKDPYQGCCPFHQDCFEGLATGPAIQARYGIPAERLHPDHPAWELEAQYIAAGLHNLMLTLSPQKIILGGGVMQQAHLFPMIRQKLSKSINNYAGYSKYFKNLNEMIIPPALGTRSGILGALAMAQQIVK